MTEFNQIILRSLSDEYQEKAKNYLAQIRIPELQEAIVTLINSYGDTMQLIDAINVIEYVIFIMEEDKTINDGPLSIVVDFQIATGFLHNLFYSYNRSNFKEVFEVRNKINELDIELNQQAVDAICQSIECQLGKNSPNRLLIPGATTPSAQFALACSIYYKKIK